MKRSPDVKVPVKDIKPGQIYRGYETTNGDSTTIHFCEVVIAQDGTPLVWGKNPIEEEVSCFTRRMTWDEERDWMKSQIDLTKDIYQLNLIGLHNNMYDVGDAVHQMWNGWIQADWIEQLVSLEDENFFIVGVAPPPYGAPAFREPVAFVCEYIDDGERFWCHSEKDWIDDMREDTLSIYNKMMEENAPLFGDIWEG